MEAEARATPPDWWWLSFVDPDAPEGTRFLGVAIVLGWGMVDAVVTAHALGINPGGQVAVVEVPAEHLPPPEFRERLLSREEAEVIRVQIDGVRRSRDTDGG